MEYLHWKEEKITDFSKENITKLYNQGFVFTRIDKGVMHQTRSVRIDISKFELMSENRRILKKVEDLLLKEITLPYSDYNWEIGKMAKDFYEAREASFSANKIKELITTEKSNFNLLLNFSGNLSNMGFVICYTNSELIHYSYPFYDGAKDMGLGMMIKAIIFAKEKGIKYFYLGSLQRPGDVYKLQFEGMEWFDGKEWSLDLEKAKEELKG